MKPNDLPELDDRLWSWGHHFKDRMNWGRCGSAESHFKPHSNDFASEGWGEPVPPQKTYQLRSNAVLEAIRTNEEIMKLDKVQKWALTYFYCYPVIPRFKVLKAIKRFTGRRLSWTTYMEQVEIGKMKVLAALG